MATDAPPRRRRARKADPAPAPSSLLASAAALTAANFERATGIGQPFQKESWDLYEAVGPLAYVADWYENALGKAKLVAMQLTSEGLVQVKEGPAFDALAEFAGGPILQKTLVGKLGIHLFVPGECFLVGQDSLGPQGEETGMETWSVYSTEELTWAGTGWRLDIGDGRGRPLDEGRPPDFPSLVVRVWSPAPRRSWLADSPVRHVLTDLREYVGITLAVQAILQSRLAGNGLLLLPSEIDFPTGDADPTSSFMQVLLEVMQRALANPGSPAASAPLVVQVKGEYLDKVQHLTFWSELDEHLAPMREACITRIALGLDIPKEVLTGTGDVNHWGCVDTDTEILTPAGWCTLDEIGTGTTVRTLNHETGLAEWAAVEAVSVYDVVGAPMRYFSGQAHDSLTTLNHRWPVVRADSGDRRWTDSASLNATDRIVTAAASADSPAQPKWADDLVELVGWYWTEGSQLGRSGAVIAQSQTANPQRVARIRGVLTRMFGPARPNVRGLSGPGWCERAGRGGAFSPDGQVVRFRLNKAAAEPLLSAVPGKRLRPEWVAELTAAQLELLIDVSCQGDGHHYSQGILDIWQANPAALDGYEMALILSGRALTRTVEGEGWTVCPRRSSLSGPVKAAYEAQRLATMGASDQIVGYTGRVWCPQTRNGSWLARRNGTVFYTGNSWQISEDAITLHIEPALLAIVTALTDGYYQPALKVRGVANPETYVVWYDTSELTQRPNNFGEALQLYDRGGLQIAAVRRAGGYSEADAATSEDLARVKDIGGGGGAPSVPPGQTKEAPAPPGLTLIGAAEPGCDCDRATLLAGVDARVLRALELVGKRLAVRRDRAATKSIPAHDLHVALHGQDGPRLPAARLFADLWAGLGELAEAHGIDPAALEQTLHGYVRSLVSNGEPHTAALLADTLDAAGY